MVDDWDRRKVRPRGPVAVALLLTEFQEAGRAT